MYLFSKFPLLSAPFYRILKKFTVGTKKAHTFGSVGVLFDTFFLERTRKSNKYWILGTPSYFNCLNVLEMSYKGKIHENLPFSLLSWMDLSPNRASLSCSLVSKVLETTISMVKRWDKGGNLGKIFKIIFFLGCTYSP